MSLAEGGGSAKIGVAPKAKQMTNVECRISKE